MKKILTLLVILVMGASVSYGAPRAKIFIKNVSPYDLKTYSALIPDSTVSQGMKVVPKNNYVYLSVFNFGDTAAIQSQTWSFMSKPTGSGATLVNIPSLNWVKFLADSTGTYNVKVSITTSTGSKDTTMNIYCANYIGVGNFEGVSGEFPKCMTCHAAMPTFTAIFNTWKVSAHGQTFKYMIDSGSTGFGTSCMKCHTTGYDHNRFANNGGFDDKARQLGWVWQGPPHTGKWDSLKTYYPGLVNLATIGCESCHGPGSEHALTTDTNKMDKSVSSGRCAKCHDSPWRYPHYSQWKNSLHSDPLFEGRTVAASSRNTFSDCNRCHDGYTYVGFTKNQAYPPNITTADKEGIGCASCHDPHGNTNDYSLRNRPAGSDTLSGGFTYPNAGNGKVCLDCHKARQYNVRLVQTKVNSAHWGPHGSTQGDVLLGKNAAMFNGIPYISGSHKNITDMCVGCHMATTTDTGTVTRDKVGGHSMNLHYSATNYDHMTGCVGCHPGKTKFDDFIAPEDYDGDNTIEPWQKEVEGCIKKLRIALPPVGLDSVNWQLIAADSNNVNLRKAYFNYQYINNDGSLGMHNPFYTIQVLLTSVQYSVGVKNISSEIPSRYELSQNYPNPFNPNTKINFAITKNENVSIKVYDMMGREVITLVNQKMNPGKYSTEWTSISGNGQKVASGVYFYRLVTPSYTEVKKMILVK